MFKKLKFKNQKYCSIKGAKRKNEDFFYIDDNLMIIGDGASGIGVNYMDEGLSDAAWFSSNVIHELSKRLRDKNYSIQETLYEILNELKPKYDEKAGLGYNPNFVPSMCLIVIRILNNHLIEYYSLGDCTAVIQYKDLSTKVLQDTTVPALDDEVLQLMRKKLEKDNYATLKQTRLDSEIIEKLKNNRSMKNQANGYWILDIFGQGIEHGYYRTFPTDSIKNILLMTDGFFEGREFFKKIDVDDTKFYQLCREMDLKDVGEYISKMYSNDKECMNFQRVTSQDDVTAIYGEL